MSKEFNYKLESADDIAPKLKELDKEFREEFKASTFKLSHTTFLSAAKCFENPKQTVDMVEECTMKAFEPLAAYEKRNQSLWQGELGAFRSCLDKCAPTDKACMSACLNSFAVKMHNGMTDIHRTIV